MKLGQIFQRLTGSTPPETRQTAALEKPAPEPQDTLTKSTPSPEPPKSAPPSVVPSFADTENLTLFETSTKGWHEDPQLTAVDNNGTYIMIREKNGVLQAEYMAIDNRDVVHKTLTKDEAAQLSHGVNAARADGAVDPELVNPEFLTRIADDLEREAGIA